jgi:hypothetical protein
MGGVSALINSKLELTGYGLMFRSVHNVRIERLWRDVTDKVGQKWSAFFQLLEEERQYDCDYLPDLWLGGYLFLNLINSDLEAFRQQHNAHPLRTEGNQSPNALFFLSQTTGGVRGLWPSDLAGGPIAWPTEDNVDFDCYAGEGEEIAENTPEWRNHVQLEDARMPFPSREELEAYARDLGQEMAARPGMTLADIWSLAHGLLQTHLGRAYGQA